MPGHYLHLYQGQGGVIQLPVFKACQDKVVRSIQAIGSAGCRTCVCIYVKLDEDHCFAAHTSAAVATDRDSSSWIPQDMQKATLKDFINEKLQKDPIVARLVDDNFRANPHEKAVISCARQIYRDQTATGFYVIQALREFFGLDRETAPMRPTHGFVRDHVANMTQYWPYRHGEEECNLDYYVANEELGPLIDTNTPRYYDDSSKDSRTEGIDAEDQNALPAQEPGGSKELKYDDIMKDNSDESDSIGKQTSDASASEKEDDHMGESEISSSLGKTTDSNTDCHELRPAFYGWEGTKPVDELFGDSNPGEDTWNLFYSLDSAYWDDNDTVVPREVDCLQDRITRDGATLSCFRIGVEMVWHD